LVLRGDDGVGARNLSVISDDRKARRDFSVDNGRRGIKSGDRRQIIARINRFMTNSFYLVLTNKVISTREQKFI
jgi:hypothetical protein